MNKDMALLKTCDVIFNGFYLGLFCNFRLIEVELFLKNIQPAIRRSFFLFSLRGERKKLLFFPLCLSAEFRASPKKKGLIAG